MSAKNRVSKYTITECIKEKKVKRSAVTKAVGNI